MGSSYSGPKLGIVFKHAVPEGGGENKLKCA